MSYRCRLPGSLLFERRYIAKGHGHVDDGYGNGKIHGVLGGPFAGAFGARFVQDHIHQPVVGPVILLEKDIPGDLHEIGLQLAFVPGFIDLMKFVVIEPHSAMEEVIGLADQLHDRVLDTIVHHFYIMAGRALAEMRDAGTSIDLSRDGFEDRANVRISFGVSAGHDAGAGSRAPFSPGDADAHKMNSLIFQVGHSSQGIRIMGIAAVDDDIAFFNQGQQIGDHIRLPACRQGTSIISLRGFCNACIISASVLTPFTVVPGEAEDSRVVVFVQRRPCQNLLPGSHGRPY